jgi:YidC/Oxa1 family membrane protein insertase
MEKNRILLFFVLSLAVLYISRYFYTPPQPKPTVESPSPAPGQPPVRPTPTPSPGPDPSLKPEVSEIHGDRAEDLVFDKPLYVATVSNTGVGMKSFRLKNYLDSKGNPLEMVDDRAAGASARALAIDSGDAARDAEIAAAIFKHRQEGSTDIFEWASHGLYVRKDYRFNPETYTFSVRSQVAQDGVPVPHRLTWTGFGDKEVNTTGILCWLGFGSCDETTRNAVVDVTPPPAANAETPVAKFERIQPQPPQDVKKEAKTARGPDIEKTAKRAGMEDQFFLLMFSVPDPVVFRVARESVASEDKEDKNRIGLISLSVPVQRSAVEVYVGPKDKALLDKTNHGLGEIVNYGMFWFITAPLAKALMWIHGYVGNFGWAIVLLTLAINLALFPLRLKQQVSMQKMQAIQPQMRTLQDKLKKLKPGDPRRAEVQAEIVEMYKEHGTGMGGCFPLLLQFPFLIAFYNVLSSAIELRHAPWILWIHDLSHRDPYFVMPILMAASMLMMQKMTPTAVDPAQARMMMIMPLMMVLIFLSYPSGLMLYWLTSNLIGIGQQLFISKYWSPASGAPKKSKGRSEISA